MLCLGLTHVQAPPALPDVCTSGDEQHALGCTKLCHISGETSVPLMCKRSINPYIHHVHCHLSVLLSINTITLERVVFLDRSVTSRTRFFSRLLTVFRATLFSFACAFVGALLETLVPFGFAKNLPMEACFIFDPCGGPASQCRPLCAPLIYR